MMKIQGYKPSVDIHPKKKTKWTWRCAVWFSTDIWADAVITATDGQPRTEFDSAEEAEKAMMETLKKFGITKKTYKAW